MDNVTPTPTGPSAQSNSQSGRRGRGRGRGRGRRGGTQDRSDGTRDPADSANASTSAPNQSSRRGRGRGGSANQSNRTVNGRQFGGQLTQDTPTTAPQPQLQANAVSFVPGQLYAPDSVKRSKAAPRQARQPKAPQPRAPKSQAPDIATRTHEDIDNGYYECPICTSEVERKNKVWSCNLCWTVFHLSCIKKWSTNEGSSAARQDAQNGNLPPPRQWRCPGCNLPKDDLPSQYECWCGKEVEPRAPIGLPPHSCGQSCSKTRPGKCPHPHTDICHAGPCPPCTEMGPTQECFCRKHSSTKPCIQTEYDVGWSCGEVCGQPMSCGEHVCTRPCHAGPCGPCEVRIPARCFCGQVEKDVLCAERAAPEESQVTHLVDGQDSTTESWVGSFFCGDTCDRLFDCGIHHCTKDCHPQTLEPKHCPHSPNVVSHCACGKTSLSELVNEPRHACTDPIPSCDKPCGKSLSCGHRCQAICHSSAQCPPCLEKIDLKCRCGRTSNRTICHQGQEEPPLCMRVCRITLNCGRHACDEHCCPGEKKAIERQSTKRKHRPINAGPRHIDDGFEPEHICTRVCGKVLACGHHTDEGLCHKGPCDTCREAIFEEISCHCGRTVIQPPLPCGTPPPPCRYPCKRPKTCGHPQVAHNCHLDDESCPKCPFLVEKRCMCGKKTLKNQQCWLSDVRCGEVCGRLLKCGAHRCRKQCHAPGECEDAGGSCQQPCGKPKPICGHPDEATCHGVFACKQETPCQNKIFITCKCQAQKQEMKCGVSKSSEGNVNKELPCNDECARLERNRRLAIALDIDQSAHVDGLDHIPFSTDTLRIFSQHVKWAQEQEREFRVFATSDDEKRLRFKPMKPLQRQFIHLLAEDFGLDSESMDPEPNRHVMIWKTPRFVSAPHKTLAESLRIRQSQRANTTASSTNVSDAEGPNPKPSKPSNQASIPFNSFLITSPRFALTVDELRTELASLHPPTHPISFTIDFLPSEEIILKAQSNPALPPQDVQSSLTHLKPLLAATISAKNYGKLQLATTDPSLNILRRDSDLAASADGGWSRVAAKKALPLRGAASMAGNSAAVGMGDGNAFAALTGGIMTFAKKKVGGGNVVPPLKKRKEKVVDDWEAAEMEEEEKERGYGESGDDRGQEGAEVVQKVEVVEEGGGLKAGDAAQPVVPLGGASLFATATSEVGAPAETRDWAAEVESELGEQS